MRTIEIYGANYSGYSHKSRTACRGIVCRGDELLMSYETRTGLWMLPGGGLEEGETEADCCTREVGEETGYRIAPSACVLEIDEYYEEWKYISRYFFGEVTGCMERKRTPREIRVGMEPRWIPLDEAIRIFSEHASYAATDEMRRGIYQREWTALVELLKK